MILTIDIGNTSVEFGVFEGNNLIKTCHVSTRSITNEEIFTKSLSDCVNGLETKSFSGAIVSSVVPNLNQFVSQGISRLLNLKAIFVDCNSKTGVGLVCDQPETVGADLICACAAANFYYGSPALIIDMGTATKFLITDKNGDFVGASILPGVKMGITALSAGTAQLPEITLEAPKSVMGTNTEDCIKSGIVYGTASMIDGMIDRINKEFGSELPVYATGGLSGCITSYCNHSFVLDKHLVLKGLKVIYDKNT